MLDAAPEKYKDIPVYLVSGWYDSWGGNTTANFMALRRTIKGPVYLIMGPWIHGQQAAHSLGQVTFWKSVAIADQGAWNQKGGPHLWNFKEPVPISVRSDVLVFQSEPLNRQRSTHLAIQTIYHDATHPSHIVLPIIPVTQN